MLIRTILIAAIAATATLGSLQAQSSTLRLLPRESAADRHATPDRQATPVRRAPRPSDRNDSERMIVRRLPSGTARGNSRRAPRNFDTTGRGGDHSDRVVVLPRKTDNRGDDDAIYVLRGNKASGRAGPKVVRVSRAQQSTRSDRPRVALPSDAPRLRGNQRLLTLDRGPAGDRKADPVRTLPRARTRRAESQGAASPQGAQLRQLRQEMRALRNMLRRLEVRLGNQR